MNVDVRVKKGKLANFPEIKMDDVCIETLNVLIIWALLLTRP